jgi:hypothetical protein
MGRVLMMYLSELCVFVSTASRNKLWHADHFLWGLSVRSKNIAAKSKSDARRRGTFLAHTFVVFEDVCCANVIADIIKK